MVFCLSHPVICLYSLKLALWGLWKNTRVQKICLGVQDKRIPDELLVIVQDGVIDEYVICVWMKGNKSSDACVSTHLLPLLSPHQSRWWITSDRTQFLGLSLVCFLLPSLPPHPLSSLFKVLSHPQRLIHLTVLTASLLPTLFTSRAVGSVF